MSTKGYGGRKIRETVTIQTDDKQNPGLSVTVAGFVEKTVDIVPKRAMMVGKAGEPLKKQIRIIPQERFPFKILNIRAKNGNFITWDLKEMKSSENAAYLLTVKNLKQKKGRYSDTIYIETDNPQIPDIKIYVRGNILEK